MNKLRSKISEYYSNLANEIDVKCEKAIFVFKDKEEIVNDISLNRDKVISKIKEVEKAKMNNLKDSETLYDKIFCFFFPIYKDDYSDDDSECDDDDDESMDDDDESDRESQSSKNSKKLTQYDLKLKKLQESGESFDFLRIIGSLIIVNIAVNKLMVKGLIESGDLDDDCATFEELLKFEILLNLVIYKNDQVVTDLTQKENNRLEKLSIYGSADIEPHETKFIETCLNTECLKELKLDMGEPTNLPSEIFKPFKHLVKLEIKFEEGLNALEANTFHHLECLEHLKISNTPIESVHRDTFNGLKNLKELTLVGCSLGLNTFNGLENLKILRLYKNMFENFRLDCLKPVKNIESLHLWGNDYDGFEDGSFKFENLKVLESEIELEMFKIGNGLEILNLKEQKFNPQDLSKKLKFLNVRQECPIKDIGFLEELPQLEFIDFKFPNNLSNKFKQMNLPSLRHFVSTGQNVPHFNNSFKNLKGLELIEPKYFPHDTFKNLVNLDYLVITEPDNWILKRLEQKVFFKGIRKLKYLRIESNDFEIYDEKQRNSIKNVLLSLFESPKDVVCENNFGQKFVIEMFVKVEDEKITEKIYFEKYSELSDNVREYLLSNQSKYFQKYLKNTKRRKENFEKKDDNNSDSDNDDDGSFNENYFDHGSFNDSDDKYMYGYGTCDWDEAAYYGVGDYY